MASQKKTPTVKTQANLEKSLKKTNISEATEKDWEDFWNHEEESKTK